MNFLSNMQKYISTFISHSSKNNDEAKNYEGLLQAAGFSVFQYGDDLHFGGQIKSTLRDNISRCHFFFLVVSEHSLNSDWVQRELGLAVSLQEKTKSYKPIIIPLYAREAAWRETGKRPTQFPVRDFETGDLRKDPFDLSAVRGIDKYASPLADADDKLIAFMRPSIITSRRDFFDDSVFDDTGVFDLYENLFPANERDDPQDIIRWVLDADIGKKRSLVVSGGTELSYTLDSRYFILRLADRAIGLGFFTYDYSNELIYGNYIGVQECWRGGNIAGAFFSEIMRILEELFPQYKGMVFEVEKFSKENVERIVTGLKTNGIKEIADRNDRDEIRRFLRICWYYKLNCFFFFDRDAKEPLACRSPCLDPGVPRGDWAAAEEDYWIMWYGRPGALVDNTRGRELWCKAIDTIYVEILAKSIVESYPEYGQEYWDYSKGIIDRKLAEAKMKEIGFSRFMDRRNNSTLRDWISLKIDLPI
jgi:hypothetical protein